MKKVVHCAIGLMQKKHHFLHKWGSPLLDLSIRLWMAQIFFQSGLTKLGDWNSTLFLFEYEYAVPLLPVETAAYMATAAELVLPWLLILGFATRFGALGMFIMTLVIELFVYPGTTEHYYWLFLLASLILRGPGFLSLDALLGKLMRRKCPELCGTSTLN